MKSAVNLFIAVSLIKIQLSGQNNSRHYLFLCSRANIDEVETEVVEIEAKLDKVRRFKAVT